MDIDADLHPDQQGTDYAAAGRTLVLEAGDKVDFVAVPGGYKLVPLQMDIRTLKGQFAGRIEQPVSLDEMDQAIADAAATRQK